MDVRAEAHSKSGVKIKSGKVKIIAIFDLLKRLMQWNWNVLYDLKNIDIEYKEHIDFCVKDLAS